MLRVGKGKPFLMEVEDRWGQPTNRWVVSDYFWLCPCEWRKMSGFQAPVEKLNWLPEDLEKAHIRARIALSPGASTVWEFDALAPNKRDWVRCYITFGNPTLVQWTWVDVWIRKPALKLVAWFRNAISSLEESP